MGCRLNIYEGEIIKNHLKNSDLNNITVINSCAVTAEAEKKVAYDGTLNELYENDIDKLNQDAIFKNFIKKS